MRKLLITLLSMLVLMPAVTLALGLGNIKLHSALNEPLNAEIELLSVAPGELESLWVGLADAQTFARLGIERTAQLMLLQFEVHQKPSGQNVIRVTSRETMREPFVSLLVDAQWNAGRLVREYTLLLDPPLTHAERAPVTVAPVTSAPAAPSATPPRAAAEPRPVTAPSSGTQRAARGDLVYGPIKADDTLWRVAQRMRPSEDISVQQMMMALLKANPEAFIDGNVNRLKAGYVLRIDDPALLRAMSQAEAAREVSRQTREWQDRRQGAAARAPQRVTPEATRAAPTASVAAAARVEPELKLVTPSGTAESPSGAENGDRTVAAVRQDLMLALENSSAQRQENDDLRRRIAAMEAQLTDMDRMLSLKSTDLAVLQQQLRGQDSDVARVSERPQLVAPVPATEPEVSVTGGAAVEQVATAVEQAVAVQQQEVVAVADPVADRPRRAAPPPPEPTMMEKLTTDPIMLGIVVIVVIVLLMLALLMVVGRRRKDGFQESILSGGTSSMLVAKASEGKETSFLSDLAISGMGTAPATKHADREVDPVTEAEVFMAYGRNQQAEEVLKKGLEVTPQRVELITKLLEVYYNVRNIEAFLKLVGESAGVLQRDKNAWSKVAVMGRELQPDNGLFAEVGTPSAGGAAKATSSPIDDEVLDIGLDLDELAAEMESEVAGALDDLELSSQDANEQLAPTGAADSSEFDFDLDEGLDAAKSEPDSDLDEDELDALDQFTLDLPGEVSNALTETVGTADAKKEADFTMEIDVDGAEFDVSSEVDDLAGIDEFTMLDDDTMEDVDEITTKLDLAQAYIEMGDADGARGMLEEVLEAGSEQQKKQAKDLLDKI